MDSITTHIYHGITWGSLFLCVSAMFLFSLICKKGQFWNAISIGGFALCVLKGTSMLYTAFCYYRITVDEPFEVYKRISYISECTDVLTVIVLIVLLFIILFRLKKRVI